MRTMYYYDTENLGASLFHRFIAVIEDKSTLVLCYSENTGGMFLSDLDMLDRKGVRVKYQKCFTGKNALDFQLVSRLVFDIANMGTNYQYRIVSNDSGYGPCVEFWKSHGIDIDQLTVSTLTERVRLMLQQKHEEQTEDDKTKKRLRILIQLGLTEEQANVVADISQKYAVELTQYRMNHIREEIFDCYDNYVANTIWKRCHDYLKANP